MDRKVLKQKEKSQLKLDLFGLDPLIDQNYSHSFEIYDTVGKFEYDKKKKYRLSAAADDTEFVRQTEIGRASCRERVERQVDAGALRENTDESTVTRGR